jgi:hypothetical protein
MGLMAIKKQNFYRVIEGDALEILGHLDALRPAIANGKRVEFIKLAARASRVSPRATAPRKP